MSTKPIDRLIFHQGGLCFFCKQALPREEASVEHLVAAGKGGTDDDGNCVVCCKTVNAMLGSMSIKEKLHVILNQRGQFRCPNHLQSAAKPPTLLNCSANPMFQTVLENLKNRKTGKPNTIETLTSTIGSIFNPKLTIKEIEDLIQQLQSSGRISVVGNKINYAL